MRTRLIRLPVFALVLATLACTLSGGPKPTAAPSGQTPSGPTPLAERSATPVAATATAPAPTALSTATPVGATATAPTPTVARSATPSGVTATALTPTAELSATPISATATALTSQAVNLSNTGHAATPILGLDGQGTLHLVWFDTSVRDTGDYFHRQLAATGDWSKAETLTTGFERVFGEMTLIRDQAGHICAIFTAATNSSDPGTNGLYQRCQAGTTWSPAVRLAITKQTSLDLRGYSPARGADGTVQAAFISGVGTIFFDDIQLSTDSTSTGPSLAIDKAGGYHVAWINEGAAGGTASVQYRFSSDQGKTWQAAQTLSTDKNAPSGGVARLVADGVGNVHLLWEGDAGSINYRRWTPGGGWGAPAALGGTQGGPNPALAVDAKGLARVVWEHFNGLPYVVQAVDGSWSAPRALYHRKSAEPQIVIDSAGGAHVAWLTNKDVYYLAVP